MATGFSKGLRQLIICQNPPPPIMQDILQWMQEKLAEIECPYQAVIFPEVDVIEQDNGQPMFTIGWYCGADRYQGGALHYTHQVEQIDPWPDDFFNAYQAARLPRQVVLQIRNLLDIQGFTSPTHAFRYHHFFCLPEEKLRIFEDQVEALEEIFAEAITITLPDQSA